MRTQRVLLLCLKHYNTKFLFVKKNFIYNSEFVSASVTDSVLGFSAEGLFSEDDGLDEDEGFWDELGVDEVAAGVDESSDELDGLEELDDGFDELDEGFEEDEDEDVLLLDDSAET